MKRLFYILMDDGSYVLFKYRKFPEKQEYGRAGGVPCTYLLRGKTWRLGKNDIKVRWEGKPDDPEKPHTDEEVGKLLTQLDADHSKSETLKVREGDEKRFNWMYIFVLMLGVMIGVVITSGLTHTAL